MTETTEGRTVLWQLPDAHKAWAPEGAPDEYDRAEYDDARTGPGPLQVGIVRKPHPDQGDTFAGMLSRAGSSGRMWLVWKCRGGHSTKAEARGCAEDTRAEWLAEEAADPANPPTGPDPARERESARARRENIQQVTRRGMSYMPRSVGEALADLLTELERAWTVAEQRTEERDAAQAELESARRDQETLQRRLRSLQTDYRDTVAERDRLRRDQRRADPADGVLAEIRALVGRLVIRGYGPEEVGVALAAAGVSAPEVSEALDPATVSTIGAAQQAAEAEELSRVLDYCEDQQPDSLREQVARFLRSQDWLIKGDDQRPLWKEAGLEVTERPGVSGPVVRVHLSDNIRQALYGERRVEQLRIELLSQSARWNITSFADGQTYEISEVPVEYRPR